MAAPVPLRPDFAAADLHDLARHARDANQTRRLLALAVIYDGGSRADAARVGGVGLQIIRDWVVRFNADGPDGLINRHAPGHPPLLNDAQRRVLVALVESGPIPAVHGVVRWRLVDLAQWVWEEFRISISIYTLSRELLPKIFALYPPESQPGAPASAPESRPVLPPSSTLPPKLLVIGVSTGGPAAL